MSTKKMLMFALFYCLIGFYTSATVSAESNTTTDHFVSDDEEDGQQDVFNTGESFYIWTTTSTKIA